MSTTPVVDVKVRPAVRTRLPPEQRRDLIVDAAEAAFGGRDPAEVTFEQIAEHAGVSRALVYNYFGDKGGLLAAVYLRSFERLDIALGQAYQSTEPGPERLRAILTCCFDFGETSPGACKLISLAEATEHPLVQAARRRRYERMAAGWGQTSEARLIARSILGLLESGVLQWLEDPDFERGRAEETLFTLLWSGLSGLSADPR